MVIVDGGYGWLCENNDVVGFNMIMNESLEANYMVIRANGISYLENHYVVYNAYKKIMNVVSCYD